MADNIPKEDATTEHPVAESTVPTKPVGVSSANKESSGTQPPSDGTSARLSDFIQYKSPEEFFEDIIIAHAPECAKPKKPVTSSSTPKEIAKYRKSILNHPETRHRFVFQQWPRDPKGETITAERCQLGLMADNNIQIWGETLLDLYAVRRIPGLASLVTYSSGSKLANCMKLMGETYAQDFIDRQKTDPPVVVEPYDIGIRIKEDEMLLPNDGTLPKKSWNKDDLSKRFELPKDWPPASPFSPSAYPSPWPISPFTNTSITRIPNLETYILPSVLPAKLVVHDPFGLLAAASPRDRERFADIFNAKMKVKWDEVEDRTYIYRLQHSEKNKERREADALIYETREKERHQMREKFLAHPHTSTIPRPEGYQMHDCDVMKPGPVKPPVFVVLPSWPNRKQIEEAHLYIAPVGRIGEGNHSFVYKAELELPRDALVEPEICDQCMMEDAMAILKEQDGENGERRDPKWDEKSGEYVIKTTNIWPEVTEMKDPITGKDQKYVIIPGRQSYGLTYQGPFRVIESRVQNQYLTNGPYCKHLREKESAIHPLTSKVYVAAKLSKKGDSHLAAEAENYQKFPKHFFEHTNGYNIVPPLHDPTPLGAVVPQFYGYYVADPIEQAAMSVEKANTGDDKGKETLDDWDSDSVDHNLGSDTDSEGQGKRKEARKTGYLSSILLLEHCGEPLVPEKFSVDDKAEAGSMIYRFHHEGWLHGSVARRNIVRQPGPLSASPAERAENAKARGGLGRDWSFRLIDFGRSSLAKPDEVLFTNAQISEASAVTGWVGGWGLRGI